MPTKSALTDHSIHDHLRTRWSPRAFSDRPVEPGKLRSLFEAARWAPSAMNEQPWRFIVAIRGSEGFERLVGCLVPGNQVWARRAAVLVLTVTSVRYAHNDQPNPWAWHDVGLAVAQLTVQATSEGLSVHQMGGFDAAAAQEVFRIPDGFEPVTAIAIGYVGSPDDLPDDVAARERAQRVRRGQEKLVFDGSWGHPLELTVADGPE